MAAKSKFRRRVPGPEVDSALVAHVKGCEKDACACRIVAFNEQKWCPELPIVTDMVICGLEGASWEILEMARRLHNEDATWFKWEITPDGDFQASCQVCKVILKRGFQFLTKGQCKLTRLKRHAMGPQHVASVCQNAGCHSGDRPRSTYRAAVPGGSEAFAAWTGWTAVWYSWQTEDQQDGVRHGRGCEGQVPGCFA